MTIKIWTSNCKSLKCNIDAGLFQVPESGRARLQIELKMEGPEPEIQKQILANLAQNQKR